MNKYLVTIELEVDTDNSCFESDEDVDVTGVLKYLKDEGMLDDAKNVGVTVDELYPEDNYELYEDED
jgi:hypothetical protein